jgi:tetratricopeptide (TPR) repeat protein
MKRLGWFLALFCLDVALASAQDGDPELAAGRKLVEEGRTTLADKALNDARGSLLKLTQKNPGNAVYSYELARVDYYRCNAADTRGDKKAAEAALDQAASEDQQSLKLDEKSAVAHSLLADVYGRRIGLGHGVMLGPRLGPKVAAENKRAQELDGNNPRVLASLGRQYLHAPKMFGGDLEKAIASFQKSLQLDPKNDETYVWLAITYRKKGDEAAANWALGEALRLNPRSVFAQSMKAGK